MPNSFKKEYFVVAQNASGRNLNVPVYRFKGQQPGPKVYIQSSIHGAEVQGNVVIYQLIQAIKNTPIRGEIILVPNCNPVGSNLKSGEYTLGRFDPVNGQNWNRAYYYSEKLVDEFVAKVSQDATISGLKAQFRQHIKEGIDAVLEREWGVGLAQQLNLKLQRFAFDADIVLDLHNGPVSTRHIYVPEYAKEAAMLFNIPHVIFIPNEFAGALDEATFCPWWRLRDGLKDKYPDREWDFGIEAFTVEMGSQEVIDFEAGKSDAEGILSYLSARACFQDFHQEPLKIERYAVDLRDYKIMYAPRGGIAEYIAKPGQHVASGELMARLLNVDELDNERAVDNVTAPCDLIPILHFPSASILGGTQLYKCFTNYRLL